MKKSILILFLSFFTFTVTIAQDLRLGFKGGVNVASLSGDDLQGLGSLDSKTTYHVGVFAEIPLLFNFSIQPELLYSAQGFEIDGILGSDDTFNQKTYYLNAPIMVKYTLIRGLSIEAGPVIGFLISAEGETIINDIETQLDNSDSFNDLDVGIGVGTSYAFKKGLMLGVRYNLGVTNVNDSDVLTTKNQNNVFQLWAGYSFL